MTAKRLLFALVAFCVITSANLSAQHIPSPKEHFGFNIGDNYMLANYTQTEAYFKKLAASSDRVKLVDIGQTEEGRTQYMLIVSSPANLANLDKYKKISQQLALASGISDDEARKLAAEGKAVVWIDGGLHSTETVATHQLIETAWQLASRNDAETRRLLDDLIILLVHANPDGQELVSDWYMRNADSTSRSLQQLPRLYQKYAGHDNNRDFFIMNLKESKNIGRQLFIEWIPQIMYNHHQSGPAGSVVAGAPYRDPFNFVFDPIVISSLDALGAAMSNRLNIENKPGYTQRNGSVFSTWYNGGLRTTTYFHNIVGLLTEIIGGPTPSEVPLVPSRLVPNSNTPFPVTPQKWYFRQSIEYSVSLNYAVLDYASRHRDDLLYNIYRMGINSIERGSRDFWPLTPRLIDNITETYKKNTSGSGSGTGTSTGRNQSLPTPYFDSVMKNPALRDPRGYILSPNQSDFPTAVKFLNALIRTGVKVHRATADFEVNKKKYPAGSFIVKTDQAFRPHVIDMFEPQDHPNDFQYPGGPPVAPYDAAGWTLAYEMGIEFDRILDKFDGPFSELPFGEEIKLSGTMDKRSPAAAGWIISASVNDAFLVANTLLSKGADVYRIQNGQGDWKAGSFYIPATNKAETVLSDLMQITGVTVKRISKEPAGLVKLTPKRIALWDNYGGSMPSGWMRWILENFRFPFEVIYAPDIDKGNLRSKYDLIIFVGGAIPAAAGSSAGRDNRPFSSATNASNIPEEYRKRMGRISPDKSIPELRKFVEAGGTIVTIGSSTNLAYHFGLPVRNTMLEMNAEGKEQRIPSDKYYIPGSILRVQLDDSNPANWGMKSICDVYFDESPVFRLSPEGISKGVVKPLAWFGDEKPLRSGWALGQAYLKDGVIAFKAQVGQGELYAFGPEITFRAQTHGTFKLLFNQLYQMK